MKANKTTLQKPKQEAERQKGAEAQGSKTETKRKLTKDDLLNPDIDLTREEINELTKDSKLYDPNNYDQGSPVIRDNPQLKAEREKNKIEMPIFTNPSSPPSTTSTTVSTDSSTTQVDKAADKKLKEEPKTAPLTKEEEQLLDELFNSPETQPAQTRTTPFNADDHSVATFRHNHEMAEEARKREEEETDTLRLLKARMPMIC